MTSAGGVVRDCWPDTNAPPYMLNPTIPTTVPEAAINRLVIPPALSNPENDPIYQLRGAKRGDSTPQTGRGEILERRRRPPSGASGVFMHRMMRTLLLGTAAAVIFVTTTYGQISD